MKGNNKTTHTLRLLEKQSECDAIIRQLAVKARLRARDKERAAHMKASDGTRVYITWLANGYKMYHFGTC